MCSYNDVMDISLITVSSYCLIFVRNKPNIFTAKMPQGRRRVPFSGKQKKQQIAAKRQTKSIKSNKSGDRASITTVVDFQNSSHLATHRIVIQMMKIREQVEMLLARKFKKSIIKARPAVDVALTQIVMLCNFTRRPTNDCIK